MTTTHYLHPSAKALTGARLGLGWLNRLEAHYAEKVTLAQLVAYMGYSRSRFFNLFREHTGLSPLDWLNRHRIRRAQELLVTSDIPVAEVARQVGFMDLPFFFRLFSRHVGCSPAAARDLQR